MSESNTIFVYYKRRYLIVVLLGLFTATNFYQHYEFAAIANFVSTFYNVSDSDVNWTSLLYNIGTVVMFYPLMKCIEIKGVRFTMVLITFCEAFGTCIKCLALHENLFALLLVGQAFPAFVTVVQPTLSTVFGANWFKSDHVAAVIGLNTIFLNAGSAFAFLTPSLFSDIWRKSEIKSGLSIVSIALAVVTSTTFFLTVLFVREKPPTPPSYAQKARERSANQSTSFRELLKNKNYVLLTIIFSMIITLSQSTAVILNQSILAEFPDENYIVTVAGILSLIPGIPSSLTAGYICKRCKKYKMLLNIYCFLVFFSMILYTTALWFHLEVWVYMSIFCVGFFYSGVYVIGMDFIVEVTYPISEGITVNITTLLGCIPSIVAIPLSSSLIRSSGAVLGNLPLITAALINVLLALFVTEDMRRHRANEENKHLLTKNTL